MNAVGGWAALDALGFRAIGILLSHRRDQIRRLSRLALAGTILAAAATVALALALPLGEKASPNKDMKDNPAAKADSMKPLPGSRLSLAEALKNKDVVVAVTTASAAEFLDGRPGDWVEGREFDVVESLAGRTEAKRISVDYHLYAGVVRGDSRYGRPDEERDIEQNERVIWIAQWQGQMLGDKVPRWTGIKALADTPENRKAVQAAAGAFVVDLPDGRRLRITPNPERRHDNLAGIPDLGEFQAKVRKLVAEQKVIRPGEAGRTDIENILYNRISARGVPGGPDPGPPVDLTIGHLAVVI